VGLTVPAGANGVLIQQINGRYSVTDASGNPVQSLDPRVNGSTSYTYYEAWQVQNGQIGLTLNGTFYPAANDTFQTPAWPQQVANGSVTVTGTMIFVSGGTVTNQYQQSSSSFSGDLPYTSSPPQGWNPSGGVVRQVGVNYNPSTGNWGVTTLAGVHP
jgi:hypothetical protein